jgi:hypothetical protein
VRRTLPFVALWFVTGALAAAVATAGVAVVDDQLTSPRPAPLSAEQVRRELVASSATSTTTSDGRVATTTTIGPGPAEVTTTTSAAGGTGGDGGPTATTAPPPAPSARSETRTYDLVGGTATVRFSAAGVTVLTATPAPGFTVEIEDSHDGGKRVEFDSDGHESRLDAWWDGGPRDEVREDD